MLLQAVVVVQNQSSQDVSLWHVDCFELEATKTLWAQEKCLPYLKELELGALPMIRELSEITPYFIYIYLYIFLKYVFFMSKRKGEIENINVEKASLIGCLPHSPHRGSSPKPRYVS